MRRECRHSLIHLRYRKLSEKTGNVLSLAKACKPSPGQVFLDSIINLTHYLESSDVFLTVESDKSVTTEMKAIEQYFLDFSTSCEIKLESSRTSWSGRDNKCSTYVLTSSQRSV